VPALYATRISAKGIELEILSPFSAKDWRGKPGAFLRHLPKALKKKRESKLFEIP
jgi:hypothetical protein